MNIQIRKPVEDDKTHFLDAVKCSQSLHYPWVSAPNTEVDFIRYINRINTDKNEGYLVCDNNNFVGVYNINEIVHGSFQSGYLGFYAFEGYAGQGLMSAGLKLVLKIVFSDLKLHRLEANIQPDNINSINLVKSNNFVKEGFSKNYLNINNKWQDHERWALTYEACNEPV